ALSPWLSLTTIGEPPNPGPPFSPGHAITIGAEVSTAVKKTKSFPEIATIGGASTNSRTNSWEEYVDRTRQVLSAFFVALVVSGTVAADEVDDHVQAQMKQRHIPG